MAGIKPACIVTLHENRGLCRREDLAECCRALYPYGRRCRLLARRKGHLIWMIYDPALLGQALCHPLARHILQRTGYEQDPKSGVVPMLDRLSARMADEGCPHEIGLFLGYPPEDVEGFIRHGGEGYRMRGQWKVYGSVDTARRLFDAYDACRSDYLARAAAGQDLHGVLAAG